MVTVRKAATSSKEVHSHKGLLFLLKKSSLISLFFKCGQSFLDQEQRFSENSLLSSGKWVMHISHFNINGIKIAS